MPNSFKGGFFMPQIVNRSSCVCFTGHRPEKLRRPEQLIKNDLETAIREAVSDGITVFITGMARGVDIWAAEIVLRLRDEGLPVKLVCASPFEGFENRWDIEWQTRYREIISFADSVKYICPHYSETCFHMRNCWMVDRSARVIAVFGGGSGGTKNTINYAKRSGVAVVIVEG